MIDEQETVNRQSPRSACPEPCPAKSPTKGSGKRNRRSSRRKAGWGNTSREAGQVVVWLAILLPLLIALVGLVFDGGLLFVEHRRARWAMDGAAVAAASEIDAARFAQFGQVKLTAESVAAARRFGQLNHPHLRVGHVYVQGNTIVVQGTVSVKPVFLGLIGMGEVQLAVTGRERPAWGIAQQGE